MNKCYYCKKSISDDESFYPYNDNTEGNLTPHELCDTPFCEECTELEDIEQDIEFVRLLERFINTCGLDRIEACKKAQELLEIINE